MLKYNNNHIFTGYLKQLLSSFNLPACKIYTKEFADYLEKEGKEDPRVLESFDYISKERLAVRINYLKNDQLYHYFWKPNNKENQSGARDAFWRHSTDFHYDSNKCTPGLTRNLNSPGITYDTKTHEYLGDYLRFLRDYHNINLMSLYNCFTDKIYNNVYFYFTLNPKANKEKRVEILFNAQEPEYRLYALPVKLFAEYTIAVDCDQGIEMFCGLYNTNLDTSIKAEDLAARTYQRVHKTLFKQPFLYSKLNINHWPAEADFNNGNIRTDVFTRWDLANREKDLKLFIKIPVSCRSSITILEGDYRNFNDSCYASKKGIVLGKLCNDPSTASTWIYDEKLKTLKTVIDGDEYVLGSSNNNFACISPIKVSTLSAQQLVGKIVKNGETEAIKPEADEGKTCKLMLERDGRVSYLSTNVLTPGDFKCVSNIEDSADVVVEKDPISGSYRLKVNDRQYINISIEGKVSALTYQSNSSVLNFNTLKRGNNADNIDLNRYSFKPISKVQLLEFNTGESYPFADRLIEYLSGSAITPLDEIPDNVKRAQRVMKQNNQYFKIEGLWENKMQNILYDYIMNSGPIVVADGALKDKRQGSHPRLGHSAKSTLFDVLGYVDKDVEKWYASWKKDNDKAVVGTSLQSVDIYDGLYDI